MMKNKKVILAGILILILILSGFAAYAASNTGNIEKAEVISDDVYTADKVVRNDGTIKGDFIAAGQSVINLGQVEGDFISGSGELDLEGRVFGDARVAAGNVVISGIVYKNVNIFAGNIDLKETSEFGKNLLIAGGSVTVDGKVNGISRIHAGKVTLSGEFLGDVEINIDADEDSPGRDLVVTKDAVIHGKLTYRGVNEAEIQEGARVKDFQWEKLQIAKEQENKKSPANYLWQFIRLSLTTFIYFLLGLLIYKLLPGYFIRQGDYISRKPLNTIGVGLVAIIAILASVIIFAVLMLLSIALISPAVGLVFASAALLTYVLLFYFSTIPVSMWLGSLMLKGEGYSDIKKFAAGLITITIGFFVLKLLSDVPSFGFIFSLLSFVAAFAFTILGIGTLLYILRDLLAAARNSNPASE